MEEFTYDHTWEQPGSYNWKTLIDNYNECYHCLTSHPLIVATSNLDTYDVKGQGGFIQHFVDDKEGLETHIDVAPTFLFPAASYSITNHFWYMMRVVPTSPTTSTMQYDVYRHKDSTDEVFLEFDDMFKQIEREDKWLSDNAQTGLNSNTYTAGPLHPFNEKGVIFFKTLVKEDVLKHHAAEEKAGREIWPARRDATHPDAIEEDAFCKGLCHSKEASLNW